MQGPSEEPLRRSARRKLEYPPLTEDIVSNDIVIPMTIHVIDKEEAHRGGWPLRRSASLESRDNPFLPGSPLAKETDDLLKRATIIRDKFYLDKDGNRIEAPSSPNGIRDTGDHLADNAKAVVDEVIASVQQGVNQAAAPALNSPSKENGKVKDLVTPESVKLDLNDKDQAIDGNVTDKPSSPKNKKKEKNKCCTIM
ncbi:hypothetical protein SNE40_004370 [Patella caerulea]|uniref:Uncharacterized protein n=1 Tax=Patella caerulea TaxID=87958 RepID=A0AAN8K5J7_PATCE